MGGKAPKYRNGYIPASELVLIEGNHWATRGTAARWEAMKADVLENEGVTLRITGGENAYRSFAGQTFARRQACARGRCNDAAVPGFSSHGGSLNGRDSGAIDVSNWAVLGKDKFYAYCRKHGFEPGYFDWEPWHIIDWNPYVVPATSGSGNASPVSIPLKEDSMRAIRWNGKHVLTFGEEKVSYQREYVDAVNTAIIHNPDGKWMELDDAGLTTALRTFVVPWTAVDACMRGLAYDINGSVGGDCWSRSIEQKIDTSHLAKSIDDLKRLTADIPGIKD